MTICSISILVLVCSTVMCLSVQENADKLYGINCKISKSYTNDLVTPVIDQQSEVTGCYSSTPTSTNQEVHVISLISSGSDSDDTRNEYLPSVTVNVQQRTKEKYSKSSVIIILHSFTAVMWQINLLVGNSTNFHVIVNKPSYVVPSVASTISRRKFPSMKRLPSWIKSHYGAVTSYSLIPLANEITLFLSMGASITGRDCNFSSKIQSANVKASFVQVQPAIGCSVNSALSKNSQIMYVIELDSKVPHSDTVVHLQQHTNSDSAWKTVVEQNIILVLKSHVPIEWIVKSTGIQGSLLIVAEYPVYIRTNSLFITTKILRKVLPSSSSVLLSTLQNSLGTVDTYMKTTKANRINIIVKGKIKYLDESPFNQNKSFLDSLNNLSASWSSIASFPTDKNKSIGENIIVSKEMPPHSWDHLLAKKMSLKCSMEKFTLEFPIEETKKSLAATLSPNDKLLSISLADENCKIKQNETHFILEATWHDCGTKEAINGGFEYHNQVQFITAKQDGFDKESLKELKHLPMDDDDYIAEYGSGSDAVTMSYLNNEENVIYPLPFHCVHFISKNNHDASSKKFELNLYTKKDFQSPLTSQSFPLDVTVHNHLFAEASIKADLRLCIVVDECWLSQSDSTSKKVGKKSMLIKQGCATDLSVDILTKSHCGILNPDADHYKMQFSFQLSEELMNQNLFLHCRLTSCAMKDSKELNSKQCISDENFCLKQSLRPYLDTLLDKKSTMFAIGPFRVIPKKNIEKKKEILSFIKPESSSPPGNIIADNSFDKLTGMTKKNPVSQQLVFVGLSTEAVVGIAFASFIIGAGLMATLWLIHMHTEPARRSKQSRKNFSKQQARNDSQLNSECLECADNSTPCSVKPLSVQICS